MNPAEATAVVEVLNRDLRRNDQLIVDLVLWYYFILRAVVFWVMFSAIMKVFCNFLDRNIV